MRTQPTKKARAPKVETPDAPFQELGATGLKHSAGLVDDDFLTELRSSERRHKLYREIRDNSPVIGGAFFAIENILRGVQLDVRPPDEMPDDTERVAFVKSALDRMAQPWGATLTQALSMLAFGWALLEVVYERRPDGKIGWRKMIIRSQESLDRWEFDERGEVVAMWQRPAPSYQLIRIPLNKALLFRTTDAKASPEGRSLLRNCVMPWKFVKRIQIYEAIGVERGLAGIPVAWVPPEVLTATTGPAAQSQAAMKQLVINLRRDEQEGVMMPLSYDASGNKRYDLTLLATAGTERHDTDKIISRYEQRMLMSMLADFIMVGHEKVGSFSLASSKTDLFAIAIAAFLDSIIETLNKVEIPRLMALNGWGEPYPQITRGDIESPDLDELGKYVQALAAAGLLMPTMNGEMERYLYQAANLPVPQEMAAEDSTVGKAAGIGEVRVEKYSPDQPRGKTSPDSTPGSFAPDGGGSSESDDKPGAMSPAVSDAALSAQDVEVQRKLKEWEQQRADSTNRYKNTSSEQLLEINQSLSGKVGAAESVRADLERRQKYGESISQAQLAEATDTINRFGPRLEDLRAEMASRRQFYELQRQAEAIRQSKTTGKIVLDYTDVGHLLANTHDAYRDAGLKPVDGRFEYRPDVFVRSDLSGAMVRRYIILPDGRRAHPDEIHQARQRGRVIVSDTLSVPARDWTAP